jgi:hypothetical protein
MRALSVLVVACTALGACGTTPIYRNPQASEQQEQRDFSDCRTVANATRLEGGGPLITATRMLQTRDSCMRARGYARLD